MTYKVMEKLTKIQLLAEKLSPASLIWSVMGLVCLVAVLVAGAWWHLGSAGVCAAMALAFNEEKED